MRVPDAVQPAEPCGGVRLIHRRIRIDPRVTASHLVGVVCEQLWKLRIQQIRMFGAAAMVNQSSDWTYPKSAHSLKRCIGVLPQGIAKMSLPRNTDPQCTDTQRCNGLKIALPFVMS